jgi:hypothetical protein
MNFMRYPCDGRAFVLVGCAVLAAHGFPVIGSKQTTGLAATALLYLVVGIHGVHGTRFDPMSVFWWAVLAVIVGALLVFKFVGLPICSEAHGRQ